MRWAKTSLRNSFFGWLGHDVAPPVPEDCLEAVRKAMLAALDQADAATHATLERKLLFAKDVGELWYARPDLMNAVSATQGEFRARQCLAEITVLFKGIVPGAAR